jgi:hypothetical protein
MLPCLPRKLTNLPDIFVKVVTGMHSVTLLTISLGLVKKLLLYWWEGQILARELNKTRMGRSLWRRIHPLELGLQKLCLHLCQKRRFEMHG